MLRVRVIPPAGSDAQPVEGAALVDTGATVTLLHAEAFAAFPRLRMAAGWLDVLVATSHPEVPRQPQPILAYDDRDELRYVDAPFVVRGAVAIEALDHDIAWRNVLTCRFHRLGALGRRGGAPVVAVIGRDLLSITRMTWDGPCGRVTLQLGEA